MAPHVLDLLFTLKEPLEELARSRMLRVINDFFWWTLFNDHTTVDKDHTVSCFASEGYLVSNDNHRQSALRERAHCA